MCRPVSTRGCSVQPVMSCASAPSFDDDQVVDVLADVALLYEQARLNRLRDVLVLEDAQAGRGGILEDVFKSAGPDTYVLVGACAPETQAKLFKRVMRTAGFDERRLVSVDIRGTNNEGIEQRLKEAVEGILRRAEEGPQTAVAS